MTYTVTIGDLMKALYEKFLQEFNGDEDAAAMATELAIIDMLSPDPSHPAANALIWSPTRAAA